MPKFPSEFSSRGTVKTSDKLMIHNIDTGATEYTTVAELFEAITIPDINQASATPQYVKPENIIFSEHSNVLEDWDVLYGTSDLDRINCLHSPTFTNVKLIGINGNTSPQLTKKLPAPLNISDKHIAFYYYYIPKGSTVKQLNLHFDSSASKNAQTDYYEILVYNLASQVGGYPGWHLFTGSTGAFEWKTKGSPVWANIKYIRILAESDGTINSDVTIGPIYAFIPPNAKALVSIGMDGAYSGHLKAVNYANSKGYPNNIICQRTPYRRSWTTYINSITGY
jgi:hypothetical protein